MELELLILAIIIVLIIGIAVMVFIVFGFKTTSSPQSGNSVYDALYMNSAWYDTNKLPYSFEFTSTPGTMQFSFYDNQGYLQGMSSFTASYVFTTPSSLTFNITGTIKNYSGVTPPTTWNLSLTQNGGLNVVTSKFSKVLSLNV